MLAEINHLDRTIFSISDKMRSADCPSARALAPAPRRESLSLSATRESAVALSSERLSTSLINTAAERVESASAFLV